MSNNDRLIELLVEATYTPKETNMILSSPPPKSPEVRKKELMVSLMGYGMKWTEEPLKDVPEPPELPMEGMWLVLVWIKFHWNRLIGNDLRADFLNEFLEDHRHNKEYNKDRLTTIRLSKLRQDETYRCRIKFREPTQYFKQLYWKYDKLKPAIDHIISRAILDWDFNHPLLTGLFSDCKSFKELTAKFKMIVNYWDDVDYHLKQTIIEQILSNYQKATPDIRQEVEDLLNIINVVYNKDS